MIVQSTFHRFPAFIPHFFQRFGKQFGAVGALISRVGVRKVPADVAHGSSPEQSIGDGMQQNIGIGVSVQA